MENYLILHNKLIVMILRRSKEKQKANYKRLKQKMLEQQDGTKRELQVYSRKRKDAIYHGNEVPIHCQSSLPNMVEPKNLGEYI